MATSLGMDGYAELQVSMMDPTEKKPAFRGLKLYVKELDSKTLPPFLARLCAPDKPSSYSEEEILCIFETAAEVHGRTIVPHIGQIVPAVVRIMASDSRPLHSAGCSKVVCTISRYCIDPLGREEEKSEIMTSLCRPLSDCLMNSNKSISSGSALCIAALVQSNNWQFASNELINDVCLKVSGALEEAYCQTVVHVGLVVALLKHNPLTLEPYGRSLIRSGLQILDHSTKANNSQMIMSSIQMIHSIMRSLNLRIISSEISSIIHALEHCQDGFVPDICTAAFQATETAKLLGRQEERGARKNVSPLGSCSGGNSRKGSNSPIDHADIRDSGSSGSPRELQSVPCFSDFNSQPPVGQCTGILGTTRARRRLRSYGTDFSHGVSNDELFHTSARDYHENLGIIAQSDSADLVKSSRRRSDVLTRIGDPCPTCLTPRATNQACKRQALSTPRKQLQSLTYCSDSERDGHRLPPRSVSRLMQRPDHLLFQKIFQSEERKGYCNSTQQRNQLRTQTRDLLTEDLKFLTSSRLSDSARAPPCEEHQCDGAAEHQKVTGMEKRETNCRRSNRLTLFICAMVFAALLLILWKQQDPSNELYFVPT
ncbi:protein SINE1-like [Miscanthus floridulus]|uniref:protein SINE1-like n=1 Tax=Miscanthus floridulus TaxID=154761 RepID=UPI0034582C41